MGLKLYGENDAEVKRQQEKREQNIKEKYDRDPREAAQKIADYDAEHKSNNPSPNRDEESSGGDNSSSNGGSSGGNGSNSNSNKKAEELKSGSVANTIEPVAGSAAIPGTIQAELVAVAIANKGIPKATATKVTTTSTNLTSKNINNWKQRVDRAISRDLLTSLKKSYDDVVQMAKITSSQDDNALSSNLKSLSNVIDTAYQKLSTFIKYFDTDLTTYINTMEKAEKTASDKVKSTTDAFSEAASKISSLKM